VDDDFELGGTAQTPYWWVSSAVVDTMDELETDVASWKYDNESGPRR